MGALAIAQISLEEYLHSSEYEHCEYWNGQAFEINVGTLKHSFIQNRFALLFGLYFQANPIGFSGTELRCLIRSGSTQRFRLPDVSAVLGNVSFEAVYLDGAPELVVEIKSLSDTITMLVAKMEEYLDAGTKLGWLVIPEEKSVIVFQPGRSPHPIVIDDQLSGGDVLPGLVIALDEIFPS